MNFCDQTQFTIKSGNGGSGAIAWRRTKKIAKGGPEGGDGGKGGDVIFRVNPHLNTLSHLNQKKLYGAETGEAGMKQRKHGKNGEDLIIEVPAGTLIYKKENEKEIENWKLKIENSAREKKRELLADLSNNHQTFAASLGGKGGFGNAHFVSSIRQAPNFAELGEETDPLEVQLELKLVADVAIIGIPSAGKSSLIQVISNSKSPIGNYHFTTLVPHLGVAQVSPTETFVLADIPGLIEGAAEGKGLGHKFLKHTERSRLILHLIDPTQGDPLENFKKINAELKKFSTRLAKQPQVVVINKSDLIDEDILLDLLKDLKKSTKSKVFTFYPHPISAGSTHGTQDLKKFLYQLFQDNKDSLSVSVGDPSYTQVNSPGQMGEHKVFRPHLTDERYYRVEKLTAARIPNELKDTSKKRSIYKVTGKRIEQIVNMTNFENTEAVERVYDVLKKMKIKKELQKLGAVDQDRVIVGRQTIEFRSW
jgi:GTPase